MDTSLHPLPGSFWLGRPDLNRRAPETHLSQWGSGWFAMFYNLLSCERLVWLFDFDTFTVFDGPRWSSE